MNDIVIETYLENIDRRLTRVEQILPTVATKEDLRAAIAPLATKEEVRESRRHMDIAAEALRADIQLLAEHLAGVMSVVSEIRERLP